MSCENIDFEYVFKNLFDEIFKLQEISEAAVRETCSLQEEIQSQKWIIQSLTEEINFVKGELNILIEKGGGYE